MLDMATATAKSSKTAELSAMKYDIEASIGDAESAMLLAQSGQNTCYLFYFGASHCSKMISLQNGI